MGLAARAAKAAGFVLFCFFIGLGQRFWSSRVLPRLNPAPPAGIDLKAELARRQEQLESELRKLPPDSQKFFREMLLDSREEVLTSPFLASAAKMTFAAADDDPEAGALAAERRYELFKKYEGVLEAAIWVVSLGAIAFLGASLFGRRSPGKRLASLCLSLSDGWLFVLSCLCAAWSGLSLKNPWASLPLGFYLAPIAASAASLLPDSSDEAFGRTAAALAAPAACWALALLAAAL